MDFTDNTKPSPRKLSVFSLEVIEGGEIVTTMPLWEGKNTLGRAEGKKSPDVNLEKFDPNDEISRNHAVITVASRTATIEDVGSTNGTIVSPGEGLEPFVLRVITPGTEFILGSTRLRLVQLLP